jgi:hypothetical protein
MLIVLCLNVNSLSNNLLVYIVCFSSPPCPRRRGILSRSDKLIKWGIKRHRNKGKKWVVQRYFKTIGGNNWAFATTNKDKFVKLYEHSETEIKRFVKVKGNASPFDGNLVDWSSRMGTHPEMPTGVAKLLKIQKGKMRLLWTLL